MKAYERRENAAYPYFKLAEWDARSMTWKAGKATAETEGDAYSMSAGKHGTYRVERFDENGSEWLPPFKV